MKEYTRLYMVFAVFKINGETSMMPIAIFASKENADEYRRAISKELRKEIDGDDVELVIHELDTDLLLLHTSNEKRRSK